MSKRSMTAWFLASLFLPGCAVGPDYQSQQPTAPDQWHTPLAAGLSAQRQDIQAQQAWWQTLQDPILSDLLAQAVDNNLDVQTARSRLRQARAQRGITAADLYPTLNATASGNSRETDNGSTQLYSAGFDAAWEVDLFGGNRRALEAARADVDASEADLRDLTVSLLADVALNYIN
ncbi:MAG TPA: TolC family protein, partial [Dongiaceae bacterium]|nr:TolC family protein [Dongiaceae bacterium]